MANGTTMNSLAKTPRQASAPARPTRSSSSHRVTSGDNENINGSDVYGSKSVYSEPNPNTESAPAIVEARGESPSSRHRSKTVMAVSAFATTPYPFQRSSG